MKTQEDIYLKFLSGKYYFPPVPGSSRAVDSFPQRSSYYSKFILNSSFLSMQVRKKKGSNFVV